MPFDNTAAMSERTLWTRPMLLRLMALKRQGMADRDILDTMQEEFGEPRFLGEITAELVLLRNGPNAGLWNFEMEERVKQLYNQGMNSKDITTELFHEYAKPDKWQETYRKIQQMKLQGRIA
ncbi:MAG: hypothetical protein L6R39_005815 [Caloplaca ligustica]|nr:MAG: hypothetical protein L6R39_005815 [Caloplaca ligustica]